MLPERGTGDGQVRVVPRNKYRYRVNHQVGFVDIYRLNCEKIILLQGGSVVGCVLLNLNWVKLIDSTGPSNESIGLLKDS